MIGTFGNIIFSVSNFRVLTFNNFRREIGAKFAEHTVIAQPPKLEFLHRDLEEISFDMIFMKSLGVNPADEVDKLKNMCNGGQSNFLVLNNKVYGDIEFILESVTEKVDYFDGAGNVISCKVSVKLKEYVR